MSLRAHALANLEAAYAAFQAHGLKATTVKDKNYIEACMRDYRTSNFQQSLQDGMAVHAFITARTKVAARVEWQDYAAPVILGENAYCSGAAETRDREVTPYASEAELRATASELPPVTHSMVDARPVLYFEQDGAHFCYRDRPFYYVDFDYVGPDGMSAGVCPSFSTAAPFRVADFDMQDARLATAWFTTEAAKAGFRVERAPDYYRTTKPVPCHPDEELADIAYARHPDRDLTSIAEFVVYRATPQAPVVRETFDTFETWRPAYLKLIESWFSNEDMQNFALHMAEEYYTAGLTPFEGVNAYNDFCK